MKSYPSVLSPLIRKTLLAGLGLTVAYSAFASDGTWSNPNTDQFWNTDANWLGSIIADGSGSTATFSIDITADNTVHLDGPHTLTNLTFGDADTATAAGWIIDNNGDTANVLTLAGATPTITVGSLGTGKNVTISAGIAGTGGFTKTGAGSLVLSGANTYTGTTIVSAGTLTLSGLTGGSNNANVGGNQLSTTGLTVNSGATVVIDMGSARFSSANAGLTINGDGILKLAGTTGGIWFLGNGGGASAGTTISMLAGGWIDVQSGATLSNDYSNAKWSANNGSLNVAGRFDLRNNNVTVDALTGSGAIYDNGFTNTLTIGVAGTTNNATYGVVGNTATFSGTIGVGGTTVNIIKAGSGIQVFSGANTYTGTTTINAGTLRAGSATAFGGSAITLANAVGATLDINNLNVTIASLAGGGSTGGSVNLGSGTLTTGTNNTSTNFTGVISGTGGLTKVGTGTMAIRANQAYSGTTTITQGVLNLDFANATPTSDLLLNTSSLNLNGGTLSITGKASTANSQTFASTILTVPTLPITLTPGATGGSVSLNLGALIRTNACTVDFPITTGTLSTSSGTANNVITDATTGGAYATIGGTDWAALNASGNIVSLTSLGGYTAYSTPGSVNLTGNADLTGDGTYTLSSNSNATTVRNLTNANTIALDANNLATSGILSNANLTISGTTGTLMPVVAGGELVLNQSANTMTVSANVGNNTSASGITKTGAGTVILSGNNSYSGPTVVVGGTLRAGSSTAFGSNSSVILHNTTGVTLDFNNQSLTIDSLSGGGNLGGNVTLGSGTLTVGGSSSPAAFAGSISGTGGLIKNGTGTLTLAGVNSYTGGTIVNAGKLKFDFTNFPLAPTQTLLRNIDIAAGATVELNSNKGTPGNPILIATSATFTGSGIIVKTGTGYVDFWNGTNIANFVGLIDVQQGGLSNQTIGVGSWFNSAGAMSLNVAVGAYMDLRTDGGINVNTLTGNGTIGSSFSVGMIVKVGSQNGSSTFDGVIQDTVPGFNNVPTVGLTKVGTGTLTLTGANTYTGATTVSGGILKVDFAAGGTSDIISGSSAVTLRGGTLEIQGGSGEANTQSFSGVSGGGTVKLTPNGAASINVSLGDIAASNANFVGANTAVTAGNAVPGNFNYKTTTVAGNGDGQTRIGISLWNGADWASTATTGGESYVVKWQGTYTNLTTDGGAANSTGDLRIQDGLVGDTATTYSVDTNIHSLLMTATANSTKVGVAANTTLSVGGDVNATGAPAVVITPTGKSLTIGSVANQGVLTAGTAGDSTLALVNYNPSEILTINSAIADNAGAGVVTLSTSGVVVLNGVNTYSGPTTINDGTLEFGSASDQQLFGNVTGAGGLKKSGAGKLTLSGTDTAYTGPTTVTGGRLVLQDTGMFASAISNNSEVEFNSSGSTSSRVTGTIGGAGTYYKTGSGITQFTGGSQAITASGQINIQEGTLQNNGNSVNWSGSTASIDISTDAILDLFADSVRVDKLTGTGFVQNNFGNGSNQSGAAVFYEKLSVGAADSSSTFDGVIRDNSSGTTPASGVAGGGVDLEKIGAGTLTLAGANTFTGVTTVTAGTLKLSNANALSGSNFAGGAGSLVFDSAVLPHAFVFGGLTGSGNLTLVDSAANAVALSVGNNNQSPTYSGGLSGTGSLIKIGTGTQTLTGTNVYTGTTTVNAGALQFGKASAFYNSSTGGVTPANAARLIVNSDAVAAFNIGGATGEFSEADINTLLTASTGTVGFQGGSFLGLDVSNSTSGVTYSSAIGNTNGGLNSIGLIKLGTKSLTLTGQNTYTGPTIVGHSGVGDTSATNALILNCATGNSVAGNLQIGTNGNGFAVAQLNAGNQIVDTAVVSFVGASGRWSYLKLNGFSETVGGLSSSANGVIEIMETEVINTNATLTVNPATGATHSFIGYIRDKAGGAGTGKLAFTKGGAGTQILSGANITYTGATTVNAGRLVLQDTSAFGSAISNGSEVEFNSSGATTSRITGAISGAGTYYKTGFGITQFTGGSQAITASGQFNIQEGTLQNNNNTVNWSGSTASMDIGIDGIVDLFADAIRIDKLTGTGVVQNNFGNSSGFSGAAAFYEKLTVGAAGGSSTFAGVIRNNSAGSTPAAGTAGGGVELEKIGAGILTLSGANTYTGRTTVNGGTLLVSGSLSASSLVSVNNAGTLGGAGGTVGAVTINTGGTLSPGATSAIGTLNLAALTFSGGGNLKLEINTDSVVTDVAAIIGNLVLGSTAPTLSITDLAGTPVALTPDTKLRFITYTGTWDGGLLQFGGSSVLDDSMITLGFNTYRVDYNESLGGGVNAVSLTVVPEPSSAVLLGLGSLALARRRRRR